MTPEEKRAWRRDYNQRNRVEIARKQRERRKRYGRPCLDCGTITDGSNGYAGAPERCAPCTARLRTIWTPAIIIEAIRLFERRYGEPPSAADFNPPHAIAVGRDDWAARFHRDGDYPYSNTCLRVFGTWNNAIEEAGFEPYPQGVHGPRRPRA